MNAGQDRFPSHWGIQKLTLMKGKAHCLQLFSYFWIGCELDKSFLFKLPWPKVKMCQEPTFILNSNVTNAVAPWPFQKVAAICSQKNPAWGTETQYIQCWVTLNASSVAISRFPLLCCPSLQKPRRRKRKRRKRRRKRKRWKWWVHTLKLKCLKCLLINVAGVSWKLAPTYLCPLATCVMSKAPVSTFTLCALLKARDAINCEPVISEK